MVTSSTFEPVSCLFGLPGVPEVLAGVLGLVAEFLLDTEKLKNEKVEYKKPNEEF